jgi:hypothetical protein
MSHVQCRRVGRETLDEVVGQNDGSWLQCLQQTAKASMFQPDGEYGRLVPYTGQPFTRMSENTEARLGKLVDQNRQGSTLREVSGEMTRARGREPGLDR